MIHPMSNIVTVPTDLRCAAQIIRVCGWTRDSYEDDQGKVCLVGAIRIAVAGTTASSLVGGDVYRRWQFVEDVVTDYLFKHNIIPYDEDAMVWNDSVVENGEQVAELLETVAADCARQSANQTICGSIDSDS